MGSTTFENDSSLGLFVTKLYNVLSLILPQLLWYQQQQKTNCTKLSQQTISLVQR